MQTRNYTDDGTARIGEDRMPGHENLRRNLQTELGNRGEGRGETHQIANASIESTDVVDVASLAQTRTDMESVFESSSDQHHKSTIPDAITQPTSLGPVSYQSTESNRPTTTESEVYYSPIRTW